MRTRAWLRSVAVALSSLYEPGPLLRSKPGRKQKLKPRMLVLTRVPLQELAVNVLAVGPVAGPHVFEQRDVR
jgi:hypothetical protein